MSDCAKTCDECIHKDNCDFFRVMDDVCNGRPISGLDAITLSIYEEFITLLDQKVNEKRGE